MGTAPAELLPNHPNSLCMAELKTSKSSGKVEGRGPGEKKVRSRRVERGAWATVLPRRCARMLLPRPLGLLDGVEGLRLRAVEEL